MRDTEYLLAKLESVLSDDAHQVRDDREADNPLAALSPRQLEVLRHVDRETNVRYLRIQTVNSIDSLSKLAAQCGTFEITAPREPLCKLE